MLWNLINFFWIKGPFIYDGWYIKRIYCVIIIVVVSISIFIRLFAEFWFDAIAFFIILIDAVATYALIVDGFITILRVNAVYVDVIWLAFIIIAIFWQIIRLSLSINYLYRIFYAR